MTATSDSMILDRPWPEDLDPSQAGFKTWTRTILRRHGYWDDPTRLDTLTADEFLAMETAGIGVLADLVEKGNAAIARHENLSPEERRRHSVIINWDAADRQKLRRLADRRWAHQVWRRDPRFTDLLPKVDATVADIATGGTVDDCKALLRNLPLLQERLAYYRSRRDESLRVFVCGITSQTGEWLEVLLAVAGFTQPQITKAEGARRLRVSHPRMRQLVGRLWHHWEKAAPPAGVWQLHGWAERVRWGAQSSGHGALSLYRSTGKEA
jgi:hypothetical protein